jgi:hypothetical protein
VELVLLAMVWLLLVWVGWLYSGAGAAGTCEANCTVSGHLCRLMGVPTFSITCALALHHSVAAISALALHHTVVAMCARLTFTNQRQPRVRLHCWEGHKVQCRELRPSRSCTIKMLRVGFHS